MPRFSCFLVLCVCLLFSCEREEIPETVEKKGIIFLGHIYDGLRENFLVDERIEHLDLNRYEHIWLGGDVCAETTKKRTTLDYLDNLFDLSKPTTLWALGNHDYRNGNMEWVREKTGRELHYVQNLGGITILLTNSSYKENECEEKEDQFAMIENTCDTISGSSHLVFISHHLTWTDVDPAMNAKGVANGDKSWAPMTCEVRSQFQRSIYPLLKKVQARGIQVLVIAGDLGQRAKSYEYQTKEGIWFLASGINNSSEKDPLVRAQLAPDRLLYLEYDQEARNMIWDFPILNELL
ncbi:MAG: metallophosphoesterase [Bacteroidota bacterium]